MNPSRSQSPLAYYKAVIAAGGETVFNTTGSYIWIKECYTQVELQFDDDATFKVEGSFKHRLQGDDYFKKITVKNPAAAAVTIEFYVGRGDTEVGSQVIYVKESPTYISGTGYTIINGGAAPNNPKPVPAVSPGKHRKQIVITNGHGSISLHIFATGASQALAVIPPGTSFTIFSSDAFQLYNPGGSGLPVYLLETYYV